MGRVGSQPTSGPACQFRSRSVSPRPLSQTRNVIRRTRATLNSEPLVAALERSISFSRRLLRRHLSEWRLVSRRRTFANAERRTVFGRKPTSSQGMCSITRWQTCHSSTDNPRPPPVYSPHYRHNGSPVWKPVNSSVRTLRPHASARPMGGPWQGCASRTPVSDDSGLPTLSCAGPPHLEVG